MSFFKWTIFSEVNGIVTDHGKPIPGVVVERSVIYSDDEEIDRVTTDIKGRFNFKRLEKSSLSVTRLFPHEIVITQRIYFKINEIAYKAWIYVRRDYKNNSELDGKAIDLLCDVSNPYIDNDGKYMGMGRLR